MIMRRHPARTRVTTRYVTAATPTAAVGAGGSVSTSTASTTSGAQPAADQLRGQWRRHQWWRRGGQTQTPPPSAAPAHSDERVVTMPATSATFRALGTSTFVAVRDPRKLEVALRLARDVLRDVDEVCSRFRDDSDLSRVNAHPGRWVEVDPLLVSAVAVAVDAARETDGLVHPLLGRQLVQLGYDRDFDSLVDLDDACVETAPPAPRAWDLIDLDPSGRIRIPDGSVARPRRHRQGVGGRPGGNGVRAASWGRPRSSAWAATCGSQARTSSRGRSRSVNVPASGRHRRHPRPRWAGDLQHAGPALGTGRRASSPPAGSPHRRSRARGVAHRDRHRPDVHGRQCRQHGRRRAGHQAPAWLESRGVAGPTRRDRGRRPDHRRLAGRRGARHDRGSPVLVPQPGHRHRAAGPAHRERRARCAVHGWSHRQGLPRFVSQALHRNIALLSVLMLVAHVTTAVVDEYVDIRWWHALVPVGATYEPLWLGLGTLSLDLCWP